MAHFFRRLDGTGQLDLVGVSSPFPEPEIQVPTVGSVEGMVPVYDAGEGRYYPGEEVSVVFGTRLSHGRVDVRLPAAPASLVQSLKDLRDEAIPFVWSPDDGSTLYVVEYLPGNSLVTPPARHKLGWYASVMNQLKVNDRLVGSGSGS